VVVHVLHAAVADAALGILVREEPLQAFLDHLAEAELAVGEGRVDLLVAGQLRIAGPEEREDREGGDARVVVALADAPALAADALPVEPLGGPAAVGPLATMSFFPPKRPP
jgi:hypothetical protein